MDHLFQYVLTINWLNDLKALVDNLVAKLQETLVHFQHFFLRKKFKWQKHSSV